MAVIPQFKASTLETLSNIIGETTTGLTNAEIHRLLLQAQIEDVVKPGIMISKPDMWASNYILEVDYIRKAPESIQGPIFYFRVLHAAIVDNMRSMIIKDLYVLFVSVEIVEEIFSSLR